MRIRPMKGATVDAKTIDKLRFPYYASYKLDGIRAVVDDGVSYSNSGKPLASRFLQSLSKTLVSGLDGEWIYGDPTHPDCHSLTKSAVTSINWPAKLKQSELHFYAFDFVTRTQPFEVTSRVALDHTSWLIRRVDQFLITSQTQLDALYEKALEFGYEGLVLRNPRSRYKQGRATAHENSMWKMKPFGKEKFEAEIIGWYPLRVNVDGQGTDAFGYATTSNCKDDKVDVEMLGGYVVRDLQTGVEFKVGGGKGMTHELRRELYSLGDDKLGHVLQYTCMTYGVKDKPRHPQFAGFRCRSDLTEY